MRSARCAKIRRLALGSGLLASVALLVISLTVGLPDSLEPASGGSAFSDLTTVRPMHDVVVDGIVVNRVNVCLKPGTSHAQLARLARSVKGQIVGYPMHRDRCYQIQVPPRALPEFLKLLDQVERDRVVESSAPDVFPPFTGLHLPHQPQRDGGRGD